MGKFISGALLFAGGALTGSAYACAAIMHEIKKAFPIDESQRDRRLHYQPYTKKVRDDIFFRTREDADDVLYQMEVLIDNYGIVSIADLYDLTGTVSHDYAASKYGWRSLRTARVQRVQDGYALILPTPTLIS